MNVHFLYDQGNADGTKGGAELTMDEFAAAAPDGVTLTDLSDADTVIVGNCVTIDPGIVSQLVGRNVWRYHHDLARHEPVPLRLWLDDNAEHIFTSPVHRERYGVAWDHGERECYLIPPAVELDRFRPNRETRRHLKRKGNVTVASWQGPGKGGRLLADHAAQHEQTIDCYGTGQFVPQGDHIRQMGPADPADLPAILHQYEAFCFMPLEVEPFGRCVVEAWAAGCTLAVNDNIGARWWIENEPEKLETAAADFWHLVLQ